MLVATLSLLTAKLLTVHMWLLDCPYITRLQYTSVSFTSFVLHSAGINLCLLDILLSVVLYLTSLGHLYIYIYIYIYICMYIYIYIYETLSFIALYNTNTLIALLFNFEYYGTHLFFIVNYIISLFDSINCLAYCFSIQLFTKYTIYIFPLCLSCMLVYTHSFVCMSNNHIFPYKYKINLLA